ncbi:MAG: sporulation integral membrane protein YtvI [Bacillota bacterium]
MERLPEKEVKDFLKVGKIVLILVGLILFYYHLFPAVWNLIQRGIPLIAPFIMAIVIVGLLDPIVNFIESRTKISRTIIILSVLLIFFGGIIGIVIWLISMLVIELIKFSNEFPALAGIIVETVMDITNTLQSIFTNLNIPPQLMEVIEETISTTLTAVRQASIYMVNLLVDLVAWLPMGLLILVISLLAVFFISRDKKNILKAFENHLPAAIYKRLRIVGTEAGTAVIGFIRAQVILMLIAASLSFIGLQFLGAPYSLLVAILVGIADILPILGPGTVFIPWILWMIINGNLGFAVALLILYTIVSVVRQVLQPKILGDNIGLHPIEALISLFVGLKLLGVLGLIIVPIVWVVFKASWKSGVFNRNF